MSIGPILFLLGILMMIANHSEGWIIAVVGGLLYGADVFHE